MLWTGFAQCPVRSPGPIVIRPLSKTERNCLYVRMQMRKLPLDAISTAAFLVQFVIQYAATLQFVSWGLLR